MNISWHLIIYIVRETSQAIRASASLIMKTHSKHSKMHSLQNHLLLLVGFLTLSRVCVPVCVCCYTSFHPPTTSAQPGKWNYISTKLKSYQARAIYTNLPEASVECVHVNTTAMKARVFCIYSNMWGKHIAGQNIHCESMNSAANNLDFQSTAFHEPHGDNCLSWEMRKNNSKRKKPTSMKTLILEEAFSESQFKNPLLWVCSVNVVV